MESLAKFCFHHVRAYREYLVLQRIQKDVQFHIIHQKIMVDNDDNQVSQFQPFIKSAINLYLN